MANFNGLMVENTKVNGRTVNKMEKEFMLLHKDKKKKEFGMMAKEPNGLNENSLIKLYQY